ncbi:MAG TPA: hypothetical protein VM939_07635 [Gemmatimonadaceae bacterium]|nr:hypothetical protein [Gemmatimonadaceae bacterium]
MSVIALLPPRLLRHLQFVLGRERQLVVAQSWDDLEGLIRAHPVAIAIIDPSADGTVETTRFERLIAAHPSLPIVAYVSLSASSFRAVTELSRLGLEHVILQAHDDAAEQMLAKIDRVSASPLTSRLLQSLRPCLGQLPIPLAKAVEELFAEPHRYQSAKDIAVNARVPTVRLYRSFHAVNLASPKKLLVAAKLLRGYGYLADTGHSVRSVSKKLGYRRARIFADHTSQVFGINPSRLRAHVTEEAAIARLLSWINAAEDAPAAAVQ